MSEAINLFLPYQRDWIDQTSRYAVYLKARRIGITFAEAFWSFQRRLTEKVDHIFCSANSDTAKEFINYVRQFARTANVVLGEEIISEDAFQTERVTFPNGARIIVVSSNPTALRGLGGDVTWDEAAFHENAEQWYAAAAPVVMWGGHFHIISTHNGSGTVFNQVVKDSEAGRNGFRLFKTTLQDAVDLGLAERVPGDHHDIADQAERRKAYIANVRSTCLNDAIFDQEFNCIVMGAASMITDAAYDKCVLSSYQVSREHLPNMKFGPLFAGVDVGRSKDTTTIAVIEQGIDPKAPPKFSRVYRTILVKTIRNTPFASQYEMIAAILPKVRKSLVESNGIGAGLAEQLSNNFPGRCYSWNTTAQNKGISCERFAGWVAQERLALCGDKDVKEDTLAMKRVISDKGKISYEGQSAYGHADAFIALSLALEAAEGEIQFLEFGSVH